MAIANCRSIGYNKARIPAYAIGALQFAARVFSPPEAGRKEKKIYALPLRGRETVNRNNGAASRAV